MKKICLFNSCKVWGGGEKWHYDAACSLQLEKNYDVTVCTNENTPLLKKVKKFGIKYKIFKIGNLSLFNIILMFKLYKFLKTEKFDTLIMNLPSDLKSAGIAAKFAGVKNIIYRRGSAIPIKNKFSNRILFSKIVDKVIANSKFTKKTILEKNKKLISKDKIVVIYNGLKLNEYQNLEYEIVYNKKEEEILLGNAGRLSTQKGQKYLIDLAKELKKRDLKFKILIAGKGELEQELKKYSKEKNVETEVVFLGFVENVKSFMKTIDIFLLPSLWEGFGYVMIEAMAAEKPVIAFDTSNNSEIIVDGKTGNLVEFPNIEVMADKIQLLINDTEMRNDLGQAGFKRVKEKFEYKTSFEKLKEIL